MPPRRQAAQPRPRGLASLLPDHRPRTHLPVQHRVTRLAPHCAMYPGCKRSRDGGGTSVCLKYGTVRKQLVLLLCEQMRACVVHSCYSTTIAHMNEHGIPSPPRLDWACLCQTVLCSSWRSSGWETYCTSSTACTANPGPLLAMPVPCTAMQCNSENTPRSRGGREGLGDLVRRGSPDLVHRSKVLGSARPSNGKRPLGPALLRPCHQSRAMPGVAWHGKCSRFLSHETKLHSATASGPRTVCYV